jgi:hypothetical protein
MSKPHRRRWFQFSLTALLALTTLAAGLLLAWRAYVEPFRLQRGAMAAIEELGGSYATELGAADWLVRIFGASNFQNVVSTNLGREDDVLLSLRRSDEGPRPIQPDQYDWRRLRHVRFVRSLNLCGTPLTDAELSLFADCEHLESLLLDRTSVSDAGIVVLGGLMNLKRVSLLGTQVTPLGVRRLQELLPSCAIDHATISFGGCETLEGQRLARVQLTNTGNRRLKIYRYGKGSPQLYYQRRGLTGWTLEGWDWCGTGLDEWFLEPGDIEVWHGAIPNAADRRPARQGVYVSTNHKEREGALIWSPEIGDP